MAWENLNMLFFHISGSIAHSILVITIPKKDRFMLFSKHHFTITSFLSQNKSKPWNWYWVHRATEKSQQENQNIILSPFLLNIGLCKYKPFTFTFNKSAQIGESVGLCLTLQTDWPYRYLALIISFYSLYPSYFSNFHPHLHSKLTFSFLNALGWQNRLQSQREMLTMYDMATQIWLHLLQ